MKLRITKHLSHSSTSKPGGEDYWRILDQLPRQIHESQRKSLLSFTIELARGQWDYGWGWEASRNSSRARLGTKACPPPVSVISSKNGLAARRMIPEHTIHIFNLNDSLCSGMETLLDLSSNQPNPKERPAPIRLPHCQATLSSKLTLGRSLRLKWGTKPSKR